MHFVRCCILRQANTAIICPLVCFFGLCRTPYEGAVSRLAYGMVYRLGGFL